MSMCDVGVLWLTTHDRYFLATLHSESGSIIRHMSRRSFSSYSFCSSELRDRLQIVDIISVLQQNRLDGMGTCCKRKAVIGWTNVWSMKQRAPDQEVDQSVLG